MCAAQIGTQTCFLQLPTRKQLGTGADLFVCGCARVRILLGALRDVGVVLGLEAEGLLVGHLQRGFIMYRQQLN